MPQSLPVKFSRLQRDSGDFTPTADLKQKSIRGGYVTVSAQAFRFTAQLISTFILARLLTPNDFGIFGMLATLTSFANLFSDAGLATVTVQRKDISPSELTSLFWINSILGIGLTAIVCGLAPAMVALYGEPTLFWPTIVASLSFFLTGLGIQHLALLKRQLRFSLVAACELSALVIGIGAAIFFATLGFRHWALVMQVLVTAFTSSVLAWYWSGWLPGRPSVRGVRELMVAGAFLSGSSILGYLRRNIDNVLIGAAFGAGPLGLYQKAYQLLMLPITQANRPISNVVLPVLSRLQDSPERFRRAYLKSITLLSIASLPIGSFAFVAADEIVGLLLGEAWTNATPIFRALAPAAVAGSLNGVSAWIFVSMGRADLHFRTQLFATVVVVAFIFGGFFWGPLGIAMGFSLGYCLIMPGVVLISTFYASIRIRQIFAALWGPFLACGLAIAGTLTLSTFAQLETELGLLASMAVKAVTFAAIYAGTIASVPQREVIRESLGSMRRQVSPLVS